MNRNQNQTEGPSYTNMLSVIPLQAKYKTSLLHMLLQDNSRYAPGCKRWLQYLARGLWDIRRYSQTPFQGSKEGKDRRAVYE